MIDVASFDKITDTVESVANSAYEWTRTHQALVKLGVGSVILLYSPRLSCSLLLFNCVKGVGLPLLQKSFSELYTSYKQAKLCIKEEAPAMDRALKNLKDVEKEVRDLEIIVKDLQAMSTPDVEKIKANMEKAKKDITRLSTASSEVMDVGRRINSKVDYTAVRRVLHDLYLVILSGLASAQSSTIANCSIGISLGATITQHLQAFVHKYEAAIVAHAKKIDDKLEANEKNISAQIAGALLEPEKIAGQLHSAAFFIGNSVGLYCGLYATYYSRLVAASAVGADFLVDALQELADPLAAKQGVPTAYSVGHNKAYIQSLLVGFGVAYNIYTWIPGSGGYGPIANLLLTPLLLVEGVACGLVKFK